VNAVDHRPCGGDGLRSGQVAAAAGVNVETLRYYERRGLLAVPDGSPGGHRLYPAEAVTVLRVIKTAQRLGFTLDEVADLLEVGRHRHRPARGGRTRDAACRPGRRRSWPRSRSASPTWSPSGTTCGRPSMPGART
jgi:DNA-binding transcriptional MerR regulator